MIDDKILKAIEESLPAQMSGVLLKRFKELEFSESRLKESVNDNKKLTENLRLMTIKRDDLKYLEAEKTGINKNRRVLEKAQIKFEIDKQVKDLRVETSNEKVNLLNNLVGLLMKNPKAVTFMSTSNIPGAPFYNSQGQLIGEGTPVSSDTIVTKKEKKEE